LWNSPVTAKVAAAATPAAAAATRQQQLLQQLWPAAVCFGQNIGYIAVAWHAATNICILLVLRAAGEAGCL